MHRIAMATLLVLFMMPCAGFAHGVWIEPANGNYRIVYGDGEKLTSEPYDARRVKRVVAYTETGRKMHSRIMRSAEGAVATTRTPAALVQADFDNGYWVKVNGEWKEGIKSEYPSREAAERSLKYAKGIYTPSSVFGRVFGLPLEIVPLKDPAVLAPGTELGVVVYANGAPTHGAEIVYNGGANALAVDDSGRVVIKPVIAGLNYIEAVMRRPLNDNRRADHEFITATLTFVVP